MVVDKVNPCCSVFSGALNTIGERGLSIRIYFDPDLRSHVFLLQGRAVAISDEEQFRAESSEIPITFLFEQGILYCPWCGSNLREQYGDKPYV